jgi:hypothetical protein
MKLYFPHQLLPTISFGFFSKKQKPPRHNRRQIFLINCIFLYLGGFSINHYVANGGGLSCEVRAFSFMEKAGRFFTTQPFVRKPSTAGAGGFPNF